MSLVLIDLKLVPGLSWASYTSPHPPVTTPLFATFRMWMHVIVSIIVSNKLFTIISDLESPQITPAFYYFIYLIAIVRSQKIHGWIWIFFFSKDTYSKTVLCAKSVPKAKWFAVTTVFQKISLYASHSTSSQMQMYWETVNSIQKQRPLWMRQVSSQVLKRHISRE